MLKYQPLQSIPRFLIYSANKPKWEMYSFGRETLPLWNPVLYR